jgi:hypothetical protein
VPRPNAEAVPKPNAEAVVTPVRRKYTSRRDWYMFWQAVYNSHEPKQPEQKSSQQSADDEPSAPPSK